MANSKLEHYIYIELAKIEKLKDVNNGINTKTKVKLTWIVGKIFLIELIYALYLLGAFNHRKATLKQIFAYFEDGLNIDPGVNVLICIEITTHEAYQQVHET